MESDNEDMVSAVTDAMIAAHGSAGTRTAAAERTAAASTAAASTAAASTAAASTAAASTIAGAASSRLVLFDTNLTPANAIAATSRVESGSSSSEPCVVCSAKLLGKRVANRKCSCTSGVTIQRDVRCDMAKLRKAQFTAWWKAHTDLHSADDEAWWDGPETAFTTAIDSGDVKHLDRVMGGQQLQDALRMRNASVDDMVHETLGSLAECTQNARELSHESRLDLVRYLLQIGARVDSFSTFYWLDEPDPEADDDAWDAYHRSDHGVPIAAQPLYRAARGGHVEMVQLLLQYHANLEAQASDGSTAFFAACEHGHLPVVRLLHSLGVQTTSPDHTGATPLLIAAASAHLEVIKFLHASGGDLRAPGHHLFELQDDPQGDEPSISVHVKLNDPAKSGWGYWEYDWSKLRRNVTALTIACEFGHSALVVFLDSVLAVAPPAAAAASKRERSEMPMFERATAAGVANQLKPIPAGLIQATQTGSREERETAKRELHKIQKANQQIVARAEQKRLKQATLPFGQ